MVCHADPDSYREKHPNRFNHYILKDEEHNKMVCLADPDSYREKHPIRFGKILKKISASGILRASG